MNTRIMAVTNQKGGVAKTTTTVNVAACAAEMGQRVLVIDTDPQANATTWLTSEAPQHTLWDVFEERVTINEAAVASTVAGVDVVAADYQMHLLVSLAGSQPGMEKMLAIALEETQGYDLVLIDCPGTLDVLTIMALSAAHEVVIPLTLDLLSVAGVDQLLTTIAQVVKRLNPALELTAVIPTKVKARNSLDAEVLEFLTERFAGKVTPTVREATRAAGCVGHRQALTTYAPTAAVTNDYRAVTAALLTPGDKR